jgi:hypothetical protein
MDAPVWSIVCHGVAVNQDTLETVGVRIAWRTGPASCVEFAARDRLETQRRTTEDMAALAALLFPRPDGGVPRLPAIPDPVNFDGSPRNKLRDRLARRGTDALLAAVLVLELVVMLLGA